MATSELQEPLARWIAEWAHLPWDAAGDAYRAAWLADAESMITGPLAGLLAELTDLRAKMAAVRAEHRPVHGYCICCDADRDVETDGNDPACPHHVSYCRSCDHRWPCPTRRALDAAPVTLPPGDA